MKFYLSSLAERTVQSREKIPAETRDIRQRATQDPKATGIDGKAIQTLGSLERKRHMTVLKPIESIEALLRSLVFVFLCFLPVISGCSKVEYRSNPQLVGYTERGMASFYAMKYQFRKTSSGERFNQFALTAAHRTLPFGTKVLVTNLQNNRGVIVKINDRGPFIDHRIIDLSRYAFSKIGDTDSGLINVKIEVIN